MATFQMVAYSIYGLHEGILWWLPQRSRAFRSWLRKGRVPVTGVRATSRAMRPGRPAAAGFHGATRVRQRLSLAAQRLVLAAPRIS